MPTSGDSGLGPHLAGRVVVTELLLTGAEVVLCGVPLWWWVRAVSDGGISGRALVPVALALWAVTGLRLFDALRPVAAVLGAKLRQETVAPDGSDRAQRALARIPRESAALRFLAWPLLAVVAAVLSRGEHPPLLSLAGLFSLTLFHAGACAALRALVLDRVLGRFRPIMLPNLEAMRVFAAHYRWWLLAMALVVLGLSHATLGVMVRAFVDLSGTQLALSSLLFWPTLVPASVVWSRSLFRRLGAVEQYFDATLRMAGTRGPSREEPRAVAAFVAVQALPYRLAIYQVFSLVLAGVMAVAVERRMAELTVPTAARMLGALGLVATAGALFEILILRRVLRPLIRHIGSRHFLPIAEIRSRVGLRFKLLGCFAGTTGLASGFLVLFALSPGGVGPWSVGGLLIGAGLVTALMAIVVRELVEPIQALETRSEEMARGELARPVPPSGEADEIGRLMVAFEEMRRSLRDRLRSTESINLDLEREVRRRTEILEQRNAELRDALEKLRRAQDNLIRSEKLASMGRLVAGIAHEINNPVNAVINSLEPFEALVREIAGGKDPSKAAELAASAEEMLGVIQRGASRTKAIVQALHNYSRGDESVEREVNLARCIDDTLDLLRHRLRQVRVEKAMDPSLRIVGYPGQIDQVFMNLITNAAQALGERGGTIRVEAVAREGAVAVSVSDDGPGIPPEVLPRIFDPFFTTKDVGEGSGLGLSIVHGIVERHGGQIEVDSRPGQGTTFRIVFPAASATRALAQKI